jgi:type IV secretory pathway VirB3-like protein
VRAIEPITEDVLFVACTRPPVIAFQFVNVPHAAFYANLLGSFMLGVWFGPIWWLLAIPIHVWMRVECSKDHNFVRVTVLWLATRLGDLGPVFGLSTYLPKPNRPYASAKEVNGG